MKVKLIIIATLFVLCSIVFAQPYSIRAGANINLRSCAGTNCRLVETVPAGTVLQVVDRFNRWLKISRNGAEVWMADWVNYTRIEGGSAPAAQPAQPAAPAAPSDQPAQPAGPQPQGEVDNYCFTIWTCTTEEDWERGYRAYQNNEAAGTHPPGGNIAPPAPSGVTFYEFLGAGAHDSPTVLLTKGTWQATVITAATTLLYVEAPGEGCINNWNRDRDLVASKYHNIFGGNNEASGQFTLTRDCNVHFYVWAPRHAWSLKLTKI